MVRSSGAAAFESVLALVPVAKAEPIANIMSATAHCSCLIMFPPKDVLIVLSANNSAFGAAKVIFLDVHRTLRSRVCRQARCAAHQHRAAVSGRLISRYSMADFRAC